MRKDSTLTPTAPDFRRELSFLIGLTLLAGLLRLALIGDKSVWLDEAFSIWIARHDLWELWGWLIRIDQHPPLYYTLLHFWVGIFGDLQGAVRTLSALCSTLAVPIFYAGVRRLTDRPTALIAAFILAISPFHIRYAQEARMYGLLTLAVAAALYLVAVILHAETQRRRGSEAGESAGRFHWWGLAVSQAAVMLTHNTAAVYFPVALNLAVLLIILNAKAQRRRVPASIRSQPVSDSPQSPVPSPQFPLSWRRWLIFQGIALLLWSPWAWPFVVQSIGVDRQFWLWPPTVEMVRDTFRNFNFSFLPDDLPFQTGWMVLYVGLALFGFWRLRRTSAFWLLGTLLVAPIAIALLVSLRRPIFYDRTLIWITLPYYALIATGIRGIGDWVLGIGDWGYLWQTRISNLLAVGLLFGRVLQVGLLTIILFLSGVSLNGYYFWFEKEGWDEAAAYIAENAQPDDLILFNASWVQIPFEYYYRHYNLDTELRGLPVDLFDRGVLEPQMEASDIPNLHALVDGRPRLWLVYSHDWYTDARKMIPREIGLSLREVERRPFAGLEVIRYEAR